MLSEEKLRSTFRELALFSTVDARVLRLAVTLHASVAVDPALAVHTVHWTGLVAEDPDPTGVTLTLDAFFLARPVKTDESNHTLTF